jgi:glycerol kinase
MTQRPRYIAALDQGTTNTKALLLDEKGQVVYRASRPVQISFPRPAWVEQDATEIWDTARAVLEECFSACGNGDIAAIGIANQRESVIAWRRETGVPEAKCISWQCRRGAEICGDLRAKNMDAAIFAKTGLRIDPLFSASKLAWLLANDSELRRLAEHGGVRAGTVDSWLIWNLTGGRVHATDLSNASRTQLFHLRDLQWDTELLSEFGIPLALLPSVQPSNAFFGETVGTGKIPAGIPILSAMGDSHAALFGHAAFHPGMLKATYGTGSSLMTPVSAPALHDDRVATTVAWGLQDQPPQYALEGNISATGAAVQWAGEFLRLPNPVSDLSRLALETPDSGGVFFVPALVGLGAPHWDENARASISGLSRSSTAPHLARAALESIAFQVRDVLEAIESVSNTRVPVLLADGGATGNAQLMRIQADIIGRPVVASASADLSAQGAGWMAGLGCGFWRTLDELAAIPQPVERYEPQMPESAREELYAQWKEAVSQVLAGSKRAHGACR